MTRTEEMLRSRYYKYIPIESLEFEFLLSEIEVKKLLSDIPIIHDAPKSNTKTYKYISFESMLGLLKCM